MQFEIDQNSKFAFLIKFVRNIRNTSELTFYRRMTHINIYLLIIPTQQFPLKVVLENICFLDQKATGPQPKK